MPKYCCSVVHQFDIATPVPPDTSACNCACLQRLYPSSFAQARSPRTFPSEGKRREDSRQALLAPLNRFFAVHAANAQGLVLYFVVEITLGRR